MSEPLHDVWGYQTGLKSAYDRAYQVRQKDFKDIASQTTSEEQNLGNNFQQFENVQTNILRVQIQDMLINLFHYTNVPPTLNTAQLETMLRQFGGGVAVGHDMNGDLVILNRVKELGYNLYGDVMPSYFDQEQDYLSSRRLITNRNLNGDYVVFYNKQSFLDFYSTDFEIVNHYAQLLATIKATERMNILQQRSPYVVKTTKNGVEGQVIQSKLMKGDLFYEVDQDSEFESKISKLDLNVPDKTASMQNAYRNTMNEMLTLFGVYNNPETKKERLTSGESSANNHIIEGMGDIYFNARRHAVELLNNAFGYQIEVSWNSTVATMFRDLIKRAA